jgi:hypothetical protein
LLSDHAQDVVKVTLYVVGRRGVVLSPDDHRYEADLAVAHPTDLVLEVALGDDGRLAEVAAVTHLTVSVTVDL